MNILDWFRRTVESRDDKIDYLYQIITKDDVYTVRIWASENGMGDFSFPQIVSTIVDSNPEFTTKDLGKIMRNITRHKRNEA